MPITHEDIGGAEDIARLVLIRARDIAPCIQTFDADSEERKDAIAVLRLVVQGMPEADAQRLRSLSRNGTSMSFDLVAQAFSPMHVAALEALCGVASAAPGSPQGSFPIETDFERLWPGERYP